MKEYRDSVEIFYVYTFLEHNENVSLSRYSNNRKDFQYTLLSPLQRLCTNSELLTNKRRVSFSLNSNLCRPISLILTEK